MNKSQRNNNIMKLHINNISFMTNNKVNKIVVVWLLEHLLRDIKGSKTTDRNSAHNYFFLGRRSFYKLNKN